MNSRKNKIVEFTNAEAIKSNDTFNTSLELRKTMLAASISAESKHFYTPIILSFNETEIKFKKFETFYCLAEAFSAHKAPHKICVNLARSLAAIHNHRPDYGLVYTIPTSNHFLHEDFGVCNIFIDSNNFPMIIDWAPPHGKNPLVEPIDPRFVDVVPFINTFITQVDARRGGLVTFAVSFLREYLLQVNSPISLKSLTRMIIISRFQQIKREIYGGHLRALAKSALAFPYIAYACILIRRLKS